MVLTKMSCVVWLGFLVFPDSKIKHLTFFSLSGNFLFLVLLRFLEIMICFLGYWGSKDFKVGDYSLDPISSILQEA